MNLIVDEEVAALRNLAISELQQRYAELWDEEPRSRNRRYLIRRIIWRMQANTEGDLSERARKRAAELANEADARATPPREPTRPRKRNGTRTVTAIRDLRLPSPGTSIVREYKGRTIEVRVLDDEFEFEGERYKSLSAIAKAITGSHCNGFRFFKLGDKP